MARELKAVIFEQGNFDLTTQELNENATAYVGEPHIWDKSGLVSTNITITMEQNEYAGDDVPDRVVLNGLPRGEGEFVVQGMTDEELESLLLLDSSADGISFGEDKGVKRFGLSFNRRLSDGSINKYVFFNCRYNGIPAVTSATKSNTTTEPQQTIPVIVTPIKFTRVDGTEGMKLYTKINSVKHQAAFVRFTDKFEIPNQGV